MHRVGASGVGGGEGAGGIVFYKHISDYNINLVAQEKASIKKQDLLRVSNEKRKMRMCLC